MDAVPLCEPWPVEGCSIDLANCNPADKDVGMMAASEILWAASGHRYGSCEVTVRPCSRRCSPQPYGGWWWYPERFQDSWAYGPPSGGFTEAVCGACVGGCDCTNASTLVLPHVAQAIVKVTIDGEVLPPSEYTFYDHLTLVRINGMWPFCQDWNAVSGVGVFDVSARFGLPVPALGRLAMGELLPEVMKACKGDDDCRLPSALVSTISRQGVTKNFVTPDRLKESQSFGLPLVDRFIDMVNPNRLMSGPRVWDPENMPTYRVPTPPPVDGP